MYSDKCCHHQLDNKKTRTDKYKRVKAAFSKAAEYIRSQNGLKVSHLGSKPVQNLIKETNKVLQDAFRSSVTHEIPATALEMYQRDTFIFSGMKSFAALKEASGQLLDNKGNIKPLYQFRKDIEPLKEEHYHKYIDVEYNFAKASVQSAAQWHEYQKDGDRYDLQIRTAMDDHVRASHAVLQNLTLPTSDKFWTTHWTPFDWGCRCRIIQVLKGKYKVTDAEIAFQLGNQAVREEFRYNPGINGVVFPPKHPYYAQHCNGDKLSISLIGQVRIVLENESEKCQWQKKLNENVSYNNKAKQDVKDYVKQLKQTEKGIISTKRFGTVLINKNGIEKTQNINQGDYNRQLDALKQIPVVKKYLDEYKGEITLNPINDPQKANNKKNIIGYVTIKTENGKFEVGLEKDNTIPENFKLYYIKKVTDN